jgi:hypothetical protein
VPFNGGNEEEVMWCFSPAAKLAGGGHGAVRGCLTMAAPTVFQPGEEGGRVGWLAAG